VKKLGERRSVHFGGIVTYTRFSDFNAYKKLPLFDHHENSQKSPMLFVVLASLVPLLIKTLIK
jgi:hypothetical protein